MDWRNCFGLLVVGVIGAASAEVPPLVVVKRQPVAPKSEAMNPPDTSMSSRFEFMGIELGAPVVPECPTEQIPYAGPVYDLKPTNGACWTATGMRPTSRTDIVNNESLSIMPMPNKRPTGTRQVTAVVVNGVIEGLTVGTDGYVHAQELFEQLKQKLGTGVGAKFSSPRAVWELPNAQVKFNGIVGSVDSGLIVVRTPADQARDNARQEARAKSF